MPEKMSLLSVLPKRYPNSPEGSEAPDEVTRKMEIAFHRMGNILRNEFPGAVDQESSVSDEQDDIQERQPRSPYLGRVQYERIHEDSFWRQIARKLQT